jgi:putative flippase GtrA
MLESRKNETRVETRKQVAQRRIKHVSKFGAVGVLNTLLDFTIYNLLSSKIGLSLIQANIISTTVAMLFSFYANKKHVFKKHDGHVGQQAAVFLAVTAFGLYVLQTGTIHILTQVWLWPLTTFLALAHALGLTNHDAFLLKNGAKAIATIISLAWNYIMYKKVVFR